MYIATGWETILATLAKVLGPIVGLFVGWFWARWQSHSAWDKKEFANSIVLSLNTVTLYKEPEKDKSVGSLRLRTLFERELAHVYPNKAMANMVRDAGKETRTGDPILRFPKGDSWYILNSILNQISQQFAEGSLRSDMGGEVMKRWYTFCITFEHDENLQQFKPRILLIDREMFKNFPESGTFDLEADSHITRIETLRQLKKEYEKYPHLFMDLELTL